MHDVAMDIGQPIIPPAMAKCQPLVIKPHEVQNGGMEIMDVHLVCCDVNSIVIGSSMHMAGSDTPSGQPG